jgi:hypothetical protein
MAVFALVENSSVINVIVWDCVTAYQPPSGTQAVAIPADETVGIGYAYSGGVFTAPAAPTPPALTLAQEAASLIAGGLTITSAGTAALNGIYNVQSGVQFDQEQIAAEAQFISAYSEFTNGATTGLQWPLLNGTFVMFPTTTEFLAFAKAAAQFVAAVTLAVAQAAGLPTATATIP